MELAEIMTAFAEECEAGEPARDESGSYSFYIDDMHVTFSPMEEETSVLTFVAVDLLPETGMERLFRALLEFPDFDGVSFALEPSDNRLYMQRLDSLYGLDLRGFMTNLEDFLNLQRKVSTLLADYVASSAQEQNTEETKQDEEGKFDELKWMLRT